MTVGAHCRSQSLASCTPFLLRTALPSLNEASLQAKHLHSCQQIVSTSTNCIVCVCEGGPQHTCLHNKHIVEVISGLKELLPLPAEEGQGRGHPAPPCPSSNSSSQRRRRWLPAPHTSDRRLRPSLCAGTRGGASGPLGRGELAAWAMCCCTQAGRARSKIIVNTMLCGESAAMHHCVLHQKSVGMSHMCPQLLRQDMQLSLPAGASGTQLPADAAPSPC